MPDPAGGEWTVLKLLNWTKGYLAQAGLEEARLAAEMLLAHALGCQRIELYARFDYRPRADELATYRELVAKAHKREPVAYLVGRKEFYSLSFKVTPAVLIPRPETEALVAEAVLHLRSARRTGRVWDVCTGCGCVAVAVAAQAPEAQVLATDLSPAAVEVASGNVRAHGLDGRVRCRVADLLKLPDDCPDWRAVDAITANPPYVADGDPVADEVMQEPNLAVRGGPDGLAFIRPLVHDAPAVLAPGGILAMEFGLGQADAVRQLIAATGQFQEPRILADQHGVQRTAIARRRA